MRLLLTDCPLPQGLNLPSDARGIDVSSLEIGNCVGCFGCWVKTPGKCVIRDDAVKIYPLIAESDRLIYVSRLFYGSYDIPIKRMMERSLALQQAFIRLYEGETHHYQRNVKQKHAAIIAYGDILNREKEIFKAYVERNAKNMSFEHWSVRFVSQQEVEAAILEEVGQWEN